MPGTGPALLCVLALLSARQLPVQTERQVLGPAAKATLEVDAPSATLTVRHLPRPERAAAAWRRSRSELCPKVRVERGALVFTCATRLLDATLEEERGARVLLLRGLVGVPWAHRSPLVPLPLAELGEGPPCPGQTPAARGECLLAAGELDEARAAFEEGALAGSGLAHLRLGDLAWEARQLPAAVDHYMKVPPRGPTARLAKARLCVLAGRCEPAPGGLAPFDSSGLSADVALDLRQQALRGHVFAGALNPALALISEARELCQRSSALCQSVLAQGLESPVPEARAQALALYLSGLRPAGGADALELAHLAARASGALGAPAAGAQLLSSLLEEVPRPALDGHLLLTAQLYLDAKDPVRARVARDFAKAQPGGGVDLEAWRALDRRLQAARRPARAAPSSPSPPGPALEDAQKVLQRARTLSGD